MRWLDLKDGYLDYIQNSEGKYEFIVTQFVGNSSDLISIGFTQKDSGEFFAPMTLFVSSGLRNLEGSELVDYETRKKYIADNVPEASQTEVFKENDVEPVKAEKTTSEAAQRSSQTGRKSLRSLLRDLDADDSSEKILSKFKIAEDKSDDLDIAVRDYQKQQEAEAQERADESEKELVYESPESIIERFSEYVEDIQVDLQDIISDSSVTVTESEEQNTADPESAVEKTDEAVVEETVNETVSENVAENVQSEQVADIQPQQHVHVFDKEAWDKITRYPASVYDKVYRTAVPKILHGEELTPEEKNIFMGASSDIGIEYIQAILTYYSNLGERKEISDEDSLDAKDLLEKISGRNLNNDTQFFTPYEVVKSIWEKIEAAGFQGGVVLEPSAGTGNFLSFCPENIYKNSEFICVEKNETLSKVLKSLHPGAKVINSGFEKVELQENSVDLVVANVPFSQEKVYDPKYDDLKIGSLHNYFIIKSLDALKEGGIGVFITSRYTLDALSSKNREEMAKRANLLGAVRLSNKTFTDTDVVADILIFQKTSSPEPDQDFVVTDRFMVDELENIPVLQQPDITCNLYGGAESCVLNKYFQNNAHYCGRVFRMMPYSRLYDEKTAYLLPYFDDDREELGRILSKNLNSIDVEFKVHNKSEALSKEVVKQERIRNYGMYLLDNEGRAYINDENRTIIEKQDVAKSYIVLRDCLLNIVRDNRQIDLKSVYDDFKKKHGTLKKNAKVLKEDPYYMSVLELDNPETSVFHYVQKDADPDHIESVTEAVIYSMTKFAKIDLDVVIEKTGKTEDEVLSEFVEKDLAYFTNEGWIVKNHYLSGDIYKKMDECVLLPKEHQDRNMKALIGVKPAAIPMSDIRFDLGTVWIPEKEEKIAKFLSENCFKGARMELDYTPLTDNWHFELRSSVTINSINENYFNIRSYAYGKYSYEEIIEYILNNKVPHYDILDYDKQVEFEKTRDAVNAAYVDFLNENFKEEVEEAYNRTFNNLAPLVYTGEYLNLEGISSDIKLRSNQLSAVERAVYEDTVLLNHEVGTGKTFSLIAACMEKKRLHQTEKSLIITTNTVLNDFYQNAKKLYPAGRFLLIESSMLSPSNKQNTLAKIAFNDWDIIFMSHSGFGLIPVSEKRQKNILQENVDSLLLSIEEGGYSEKDKKILRRELKKRQYALDKFLSAKIVDTGLTFEDLNIDYLGVDESHNFKNLGISGEISSSQKSIDLYTKINYLYEKFGKNKNVMFATGTPITNNVFEFYNIQKYLQPKLLQDKGIDSVSRWSKQFLTERVEYEPNASATTWILKYRYKFKNVPELIQMLKHTMDVATADEIGIQVPEEKRTTIVCEQSEIQRHEMALLDDRVKKIMDKKNKIDPREDNLLKIVSEGSRNSLDPRMINPEYPDFLGGKTSMCANEVYKKYVESSEMKGTQLIFCDLGTPKSESGYVYETLTNKLVEQGIPKQEIEWIHNHKNKDALFRKMRNGDVRVLIGSTQKMGEGMNVQDRCVAIHHLDVPWRPSDVEQREGRAIRFGNMNDQVEIFVYATEKSFDSFRWNTIDYKYNEVVPIARGTFDKREQQYDFDCASTFEPADLASITATDPRLKEKFMLEKQIGEKSMLLDSEMNKRQTLGDSYNTIKKRLDRRTHEYNLVKDVEFDEDRGYELVVFNKSSQQEEVYKTTEYQKIAGRLQTIRKNLFTDETKDKKVVYEKLTYQGIPVHVILHRFGGIFYHLPLLKREFNSLRNIEHKFEDISFTKKYYSENTEYDNKQLAHIAVEKKESEKKISELKNELGTLTTERNELLMSIEADAAKNGTDYNGEDELDTEILESDMYSYKEKHFRKKYEDNDDNESYTVKPE